MKTADELVELALPSVLEGIRKELVQTIDWQVKEDAAKIVSAHVTAYIQENVLPEITRQLVESKDGLIALGGALGPAVIAAMTDALMEELKKNLQGSWDRKKIFDAMFA